MKAKLFGRATFVALAAFLCLGLGASSCEQQIAHDVGVDSSTVPRVDTNGQPVLGKDGKQIVDTTVTQKPLSSTPVGTGIDVVAGVGGAVIPGSGPLIHVIGYGLMGILAAILGKRAQNATSDKNAVQKSLDLANVGLSATAAGLQMAVDTLPVPHAETLMKIIDTAHDAMGVAGHIQDMLQPSPATAGQHAPDPAPAT